VGIVRPGCGAQLARRQSALPVRPVQGGNRCLLETVLVETFPGPATYNPTFARRLASTPRRGRSPSFP